MCHSHISNEHIRDVKLSGPGRWALGENVASPARPEPIGPNKTCIQPDHISVKSFGWAR